MTRNADIVASGRGAEFRDRMEELVAKLPGKPANASLTLATQDAEMQEFVSRLKRKKLLKRVLVGIGVAAVLAAIILGICFSVLLIAIPDLFWYYYCNLFGFISTAS